jgi:hypothetical protein
MLFNLKQKITPGGTTPPTAPIHIFKTIVTQVGTNQQTLYDTEGLTWTSGEFFVNSSQSQLILQMQTFPILTLSLLLSSGLMAKLQKRLK